MDSTSWEYGNEDMLRPSFWTIGKWFSFLAILLAVWAGLYTIAHSRYGIPGYEYTSFSNAQIRQINRILTTDNIAISMAQAPPRNATLVDSANTLTPVNEINTLNTTLGCDLDCRAAKVLVYINSEYDNKVSPAELEAIRQYISTFGPQEVGVFLADYKLKVRSYFWLAGSMIYAELVMWVVAGVLCSLLFSAGNVLRRANQRQFGNRDVLYQVAKVFYAPLIAIVLLLAYNYFRHNTSLNANLGQGVIIFAFIAGFYSGRVMNFLDKLKQLILPDNDDAQVVVAPAPAVAYAAPQPAQVPAAPVAPPPVAPAEAAKKEERQTAAPVAEKNNNEAYMPPVKKEDNGLIDAEIEVKLDAAGLFEEEKARLTKLGFTKAIVTLHNVNGKDIIPARKVNDNNTLFIAHDVKPGIYIARATLSQKVGDDQIINLFGERTSYITVDKPGLELYIRKYELVD